MRYQSFYRLEGVPCFTATHYIISRRPNPSHSSSMACLPILALIEWLHRLHCLKVHLLQQYSPLDHSRIPGIDVEWEYHLRWVLRSTIWYVVSFGLEVQHRLPCHLDQEIGSIVKRDCDIFVWLSHSLLTHLLRFQSKRQSQDQSERQACHWHALKLPSPAAGPHASLSLWWRIRRDWRRGRNMCGLTYVSKVEVLFEPRVTSLGDVAISRGKAKPAHSDRSAPFSIPDT